MSSKTVTFAVVSQRAQVLPELREQLALVQDSNASQHFSVAMMPGSSSVRFPPDVRHTGVANWEALGAVESTMGSSSISFLSNARHAGVANLEASEAVEGTTLRLPLKTFRHLCNLFSLIN